MWPGKRGEKKRILCRVNYLTNNYEYILHYINGRQADANGHYYCT